MTPLSMIVGLGPCARASWDTPPKTRCRQDEAGMTTNWIGDGWLTASAGRCGLHYLIFSLADSVQDHGTNGQTAR
jgi:hypothetical protein